MKAGRLSEHLKTDWNFPKIHLWNHVVWDIRMKGAAHNYSTWPNEKMHGTLKNAYQDHSNGKNVTVQVGTQVNLILYILTLLTDPLCRPPLFGHEIHQGLD